MRKFLDRVHVCAKFHENRKESGFFFVDLVWNDPYVVKPEQFLSVLCISDITAVQ